jgi:hypothetical protein
MKTRTSREQQADSRECRDHVECVETRDQRALRASESGSVESAGEWSVESMEVMESAEKCGEDI